MPVMLLGDHSALNGNQLPYSCRWPSLSGTPIAETFIVKDHCFFCTTSDPPKGCLSAIDSKGLKMQDLARGACLASPANQSAESTVLRDGLLIPCCLSFADGNQMTIAIRRISKALLIAGSTTRYGALSRSR